jgi:hypothetical protein
MVGITGIYWGIGVTVAGIGLRWLWPAVSRSIAWGILCTGLALMAIAITTTEWPLANWIPPVAAGGFGLFIGLVHKFFSGGSEILPPDRPEKLEAAPLPDGPIGLVLNHCSNMKFAGEVNSSQIGVVDNHGRDNDYSGLKINAGSIAKADTPVEQPKSESGVKKYFGGFSFSKGDHLKKG